MIVDILLFLTGIIDTFDVYYDVYIFGMIIAIILLCSKGILSIITKNIFTIGIIFTLLFFIDRYLYKITISDTIKSIQIHKSLTQRHIERYQIDDNLFPTLSDLYNYKLDGLFGNDKSQESKHYTSNPQKLNYHTCIKNIELKYLSTNSIYFYGEDKSKDIVCKINSIRPLDEPTDKYSLSDHYLILTVSKKESK